MKNLVSIVNLRPYQANPFPSPHSNPFLPLPLCPHSLGPNQRHVQIRARRQYAIGMWATLTAVLRTKHHVLTQ